MIPVSFVSSDNFVVSSLPFFNIEFEQDHKNWM